MPGTQERLCGWAEQVTQASGSIYCKNSVLMPFPFELPYLAPHLHFVLGMRNHLGFVLQRRMQSFPMWLESNNRVDQMGAWLPGEWGGANLPPASWRASLHTLSFPPHASLYPAWLIPAMFPSPIHCSSTAQSVICEWIISSPRHHKLQEWRVNI